VQFFSFRCASARLIPARSNEAKKAFASDVLAEFFPSGLPACVRVDNFIFIHFMYKYEIIKQKIKKGFELLT